MVCLCLCSPNDVEETPELPEESSTSIISAARECNVLARETISLCTDTVTKGNELVEFGHNIKDTLVGIATDMDADSLSTIRDLINGEKMTQARGLAGQMDDLAIECVKKAVAMIAKLQDGVDALPDWIERFVEKQASKIDVTPEERELANVEPDIDELGSCIDAIENLNLFTAMEAGTRAFDGIADKADVCKTIFEAINKFAVALATITDAFVNRNFGSVVSKIGDILRCISLSGLIKKFAEQCEKVIQKIIELFMGASDKLGMLWSALAYAKDRLSDCVSNIFEANSLCSTARDNGTTLVDKTREIQEKLANIGSINRDSISSVRALVRGNDIREAIDMASDIDDIVLECTQKVTGMVDMVTDGYDNLPNIITDGIPDMMEAGNEDDDPDPVDVEGDVEELNQARAAIEESDMMTTINASVDGFSGITEKISSCRDMLETSQEFSGSCRSVIDSFMSTWHLETAMDKIKEMCRLVKLGEMMKQFAEQIQKLLKAIILLMATVINKLKNLQNFTFGAFSDNVENAVEVVADKLPDNVGETVEHLICNFTNYFRAQ